jgi:hypothetical protein
MAGRPRIYDSPDELELKCQEYIGYCNEKKERPTITGACLFLDFCDKTTLYDYRDRPEFSHSIKRLLLYVENGYEIALQSNAVTGSIFALKNMGWKDKQEVENSGGVTINWNVEKTYETQPKTD